MSENSYLLNLLLYRPKAFLLLSYLKLLAEENEYAHFTFCIKEIRPISGRVTLTKEQVRNGLKQLQEWGFIEVKKHNIYPRWSREIIFLEKGE